MELDALFAEEPLHVVCLQECTLPPGHHHLGSWECYVAQPCAWRSCAVAVHSSSASQVVAADLSGRWPVVHLGGVGVMSAYLPTSTRPDDEWSADLHDLMSLLDRPG